MQIKSKIFIAKDEILEEKIQKNQATTIMVAARQNFFRVQYVMTGLHVLFDSLLPSHLFADVCADLVKWINRR